MEKDLLKIINHYGVLKQLKYFYSEVYELTEAILKLENYDDETYDFGSGRVDWTGWRRHIAEEIADCYVMLEQFRHYYNIPDMTIDKIMHDKIKRQLERIENEK